MPLRSIDLQVLVPKTQQQSKENQHLNDKIRVEQQYIVQQNKMSVEKKLKKVNPFEDKNNLAIKNNSQHKHYKHSHSDSQNDGEHNQKKEKETNNQKYTSGMRQRIDIKI